MMETCDERESFPVCPGSEPSGDEPQELRAEHRSNGPDDEEAPFFDAESDTEEPCEEENLEKTKQQQKKKKKKKKDAKEDETASATHATWGQLLKLAAPERLWIGLGCLALLVRLPFSLASPHFQAESIGAAIKGDRAELRRNVVLLIGTGVVNAFLDYWNVFLFDYAKARLLKRLRIKLFAAMLALDARAHDASSAGWLMSRLTADTAEMGSDLTWVFRWSIESVVRIAGITAYLLYRDSKLAMLVLCVAPPVTAINFIYGTWLRTNAARVQAALARAGARSNEALVAVRTVVCHAAERFELFKYSGAIDDFYRLSVRQAMAQAAYYMACYSLLVGTAVPAALLWVGGSQVVEGRTKPSVLLAFLLYQGQLLEYTGLLLNSVTSLLKSSGSGGEVFKILEQNKKLKQQQQPGGDDEVCFEDSSAFLDQPRLDNDGGASTTTTTTTTTATTTRATERRRRNAAARTGLAAPLLGISSPEGDQSLPSNERRADTTTTTCSLLQKSHDSSAAAPLLGVVTTDDSEEDGALRGQQHRGGRLELQDVAFRYSPESPAALKGVSFVVEPRTSLAILGPSGSGKSTIFSLLFALYEPTAGRVLLDGRDVASYPPRSYLRTKALALVDQEPVLMEGTVLENILYGVLSDSDSDDDKETKRTTKRPKKFGTEARRRAEHAARVADAHDFITADLPLGYDTPVGERGGLLSGGQKQRVAIARAVARDPLVLLLDEATSALDARSDHAVRAALKRASNGRTSVSITHRVASAKDADRILLLHDGLVVEGPASHADLLATKDGVYASLLANDARLQRCHTTGAGGGGGGGSHLLN